MNATQREDERKEAKKKNAECWMAARLSAWLGFFSGLPIEDSIWWIGILGNCLLGKEICFAFLFTFHVSSEREISSRHDWFGLMNFRVSLFRGSPTGFVQRSLIAQAYKTGIASSASSTLCFVVLLFVIHIPAVFSTSSKQEKKRTWRRCRQRRQAPDFMRIRKKRRRKKENSVLSRIFETRQEAAKRDEENNK